MISYPVENIAQVLQARVEGPVSAPIRYLATDSRKISFPAETVFFCLATARRNGHAFVADAYAQGVRTFVVSEPVEGAYEEASFLQVPDTLLALQQLAAWHRRQFACPVIGITGSNGKTIVKEWLYEVLNDEYRMVRSPKSFNSQLGVPLSVWLLNQQTQLGIFEAGISQPGEMAKLEEIIRPTLGIFTMLGDAHNDGFETMQQKLEEKFRLFQSCSHLICHSDDELIRQQLSKVQAVVLDWGHHPNAWLRIIEKRLLEGKTQLTVLVAARQFDLLIPFADEASIENAMQVVVCLLHLGHQPALVNERLQRLHHLDMRLQWKKAVHRCFLLNDSYSNDFTSLLQAFDYLQQQSRNAKHAVILSDLSAPAEAEPMLYQQLARLLHTRKITRFIGVGPSMMKYAELLQRTGMESQFFANTEALLAEWSSFAFSEEDILLKGGRHFGFERLALLLEAQQHQTELEINLSAIANNLRHYKSMLSAHTRMMVMVKAFGYGSGDAEIGRALQYNGVDYLAVAYVDEGVALRQAGVHLPILVLNTDPESFASMEQHNLEPEVYSFNFLETLLLWCRQKGIRSYPVHLKIDTGMHRLGFETADIKQLASLVANQEELVVKSVFTHLVASESAAEDGFTNQQLSDFEAACHHLEAALGYTFIRHAANTAAIARHPSSHFDMVRLGVGLYGGTTGLQPVMKLYSTVAQVKQVAAGETVGYGRSGLLTRDSVIATIRVGYADGYPRSLSNGVGSMYVRGRMAPVVGKVCMDMTMLDVTDIPGVRPGDRVEVFGERITLQQIASWCQTIPYEIMTGISHRVRRNYTEES